MIIHSNTTQQSEWGNYSHTTMIFTITMKWKKLQLIWNDDEYRGKTMCRYLSWNLLTKTELFSGFNPIFNISTRFTNEKYVERRKSCFRIGDSNPAGWTLEEGHIVVKFYVHYYLLHALFTVAWHFKITFSPLFQYCAM